MGIELYWNNDEQTVMLVEFRARGRGTICMTR